MIRAIDRGCRACARGVIKFYRMALSPLLHGLLGPYAGCRFHPTCSAYALGCFQRFPFFKASWLSLRRICRCHPWHPGGEDPVPSEIMKTPLTTDKKQ